MTKCIRCYYIYKGDICPRCHHKRLLTPTEVIATACIIVSFNIIMLLLTITGII